MGSLLLALTGRRRLRVVGALLVAAGICLMATSCGRTPHGVTPEVDVTSYAAGERPSMPPIAGATLSGAQLDLATLAGSVVVLNSWASWCAPCIEETPELIAASSSTASADVVFVGLNVKDDPAKAREFVKQQQIPYESIMDPAGRMLATLPEVPPGSLPSTLVIDRSGLVAARIIGPIPPGVLAGIVESVEAE
ncbi:MAG: TlpA family protein disulfide reductase [Candidatus Nanopelagicales bacterium]|nr:TlpA family protein disulfide reductase [Candidatus Nanopelagicales bacterium]